MIIKTAIIITIAMSAIRIESGRSRVQSPVKDRVIPRTL